MCPVCKKETRHYTKDTHESSVSKMRRIWCEDCRVVQMQFKQTNGKWEQNAPTSERKKHPKTLEEGICYFRLFCDRTA